MDLREFVETSLVQIIEGVRNAQVTANTHAAVVSPGSTTYVESGGKLGVYGRSSPVPTTMVSFDVAVTADKSGQAGGKVNLMVAGVGLGVESGGHSGTQTVSRIQFTIAIILPSQSTPT